MRASSPNIAANSAASGIAAKFQTRAKVSGVAQKIAVYHLVKDHAQKVLPGGLERKAQVLHRVI